MPSRDGSHVIPSDMRSRDFNGHPHTLTIASWDLSVYSSALPPMFVAPIPQHCLLHLFQPNLGGSARILDKVHPISAVRQVNLKQFV